MDDDPLVRLRQLCLALPEAFEGVSVHHPSFKVGSKTFVMFTHAHGRASAWVKAAPGVQPELVRSEPSRFFVPPYLGPRGWVGVHLDGVDWAEVEEIVIDGYRQAAAKRLVRQLDEGATG